MNRENIPTVNRVVALSGWRGSGKDTAADYLVEQYGYQKLSFASTLKDLVATTYSLPRNLMDDRELKEKPISNLPAITTDKFTEAVHGMLRSELASGYWTPRALCILEGSIKRSVNSNFWVSQVLNKIRANPANHYVISDMRYTSEADTLKLFLPEKELITMRINRFETIDTMDPSERDLDQYHFDITVGNTGTPMEFRDTLDWIMPSLGKAKV